MQLGSVMLDDVRNPTVALERFTEGRTKAGLAKPLTATARARFLATFGRAYGKLTVVAFAGFKVRPDHTGGAAIWWCQCTCGRLKAIHDNNLHVLEGSTTGCGSCTGRELHVPSEHACRLLALGIECEGSIGVYRLVVAPGASRRGGHWHAARVTIGMTIMARPLLETVIAELGMGTIHRQRKGDLFNSPGIQLQFNNDDAIHIATLVEPYLITKQRQADLVTAFPSVGRGTRIPPKVASLREEQAVETAVLNATGPEAPPAAGAEARVSKWFAAIDRMSQGCRDQLLARMVDFEGAIGIVAKKNQGPRGVSHNPQIQIGQVERRVALLKVAQHLAGVGNIPSAVRRPARPTEAPIVIWTVGGKPAIDLAARLQAHLVLKAKQASIVSRFPYRGPTPLSVPSRDFAVREDLYLECKRLNDRYRHLPHYGVLHEAIGRALVPTPASL